MKKQEIIIAPLPHSTEVERAVLGAMILDSQINNIVVKNIKPDMFYHDENRIIYNTIISIIDDKMDVDFLTVINKLKKDKNLDKIGGYNYIMEITSSIASGIHAESHCRILIEKYISREIMKIGMQLEKYGAEEYDIDKALLFAEQSLDNIRSKTITDTKNMYSAVYDTAVDIGNKADGDKLSYMKTGWKKFDKNVSLDTGNIFLIAGDKQSAKTLFIISLMQKIIKHQPIDVNILWFSMEDPSTKIIRSMISNIVGLSGKQLQSKNYTLSEKERSDIGDAAENIATYPIEFIDRKCEISYIRAKSKEFCKKHTDKKCIIIIDNLGLIDAGDKRGNDKDDYISSQIVDILQATGSLIIIVHHLTKEQLSKTNFKDGYRPREEYIRGSSRILDYVQIAALVNLPRKYPDLVQQESQIHTPKDTEVVFDTDKPFDIDRFRDELWILNDKDDGTTRGVQNLFVETFNLLMDTVNKGVNVNRERLTPKFIKDKYATYCNYINSINSGREEQYYKPKASIYQFLKRKMYYSDFSPDKDSRQWYLYGDNQDNFGIVEKLFIVDIIKNREGDTDDVNDRLIRFYPINLNRCEFKEWK